MSVRQTHRSSGLFANPNVDRNKIIDLFRTTDRLARLDNDNTSSDDIPDTFDHNSYINNGNRIDLTQFDNDSLNSIDSESSEDHENSFAILNERIYKRQYGGKMYPDTDADENYDINPTMNPDPSLEVIPYEETNRYTRGNRDRQNQRQLGRADKYEPEYVELDDNKVPIYRQIVLNKTSDVPDFSKQEPTFVLRADVDYPQFAMGFTHWIHASKNKTEVFNTFTNKKRVYLVINGYERYVDDYDESIGNISKQYFDLGKGLGTKPNILSRAFYKLWEILYFFDLIDVNSKNFVSAHLAEGPGSFIQAVMFYRDMFCKDAKNDKYHAVTIHGDNEDNSLDLEKEFVQFYAKEKPQRFFMHQTYDSQTARASPNKDNGDLTKAKTIENFTKSINGKADFVTADGGFEWNNENIQEQECAILIYAQILAAINVQKKGGSFVLKIFETFTSISLKFILILKYFYEDVNIIKPFTSRESNSEKYVVCKKFKFGPEQVAPLAKKMLGMLDDIDQINEKRDKPMFLYDIFTNVTVPDDLKLNMISINNEISNRQFKVINKIIEYLEGSNFHGELYMRYRNRQIELTKYWLSIFMAPDKNLIIGKEKAEKLLEPAERTQTLEYDRFRNRLIGYDVPKDIPKDIPKDKPIDKSKPPSTTAPVKKIARAKSKAKAKSKSKSKSKDKPKPKKTTQTKVRVVKVK